MNFKGLFAKIRGRKDHIKRFCGFCKSSIGDFHSDTPGDLSPTRHRLTNGLTPIEWIVNDMVIRFALSGKLNGLQQ